MSNYLTDYLHYSTSNEAPSIYHKWSALSSISHLIGPRCWTHMGGFLTWYPNIYIALVGEPGMMKTTAMIQARTIVESIPTIGMAPTSTSKENIVDLMADDKQVYIRTYLYATENIKYTQMSIFASEFVSFINGSGNPGSMIDFLTDIWDRAGGEFKESFKNKGRRTLVHPYVSILACLTPSVLHGLINTRVISSGMSRRNLFVYAYQNGEPITFIKVDADKSLSWDRCIAHAKFLQDVKGPFTWDADAEKVYDEWYVPFKRNIINIRSNVLKLFYNSKAEYVVKVSMLLNLAEYAPRLVHSVNSITQAIALVTEVETGVCQLFDNAGRNELMPVAEDIEKYICQRTKVLVKTIYVTFYRDVKDGDVKEIDRIIEHLIRAGKVEKEEVTSSGKLSTYVKWIGEKASSPESSP